MPDPNSNHNGRNIKYALTLVGAVLVSIIAGALAAVFTQGVSEERVQEIIHEEVAVVQEQLMSLDEILEEAQIAREQRNIAEATLLAELQFRVERLEAQVAELQQSP